MAIPLKPFSQNFTRHVGFFLHFSSLFFLSSLFWTSAVVVENLPFEEHPANQSVIIGSDLLLRCTIAHHGENFKFHVQWRTNRGIILNKKEYSNHIPGYSGRYSFFKENPTELHLNIRNVSLDDEGQFQCQLLKPGGKFVRANFITVLVPPSDVRFQHYQSGSTIATNERIPLNITCVTDRAKPEVIMNLFVNGKKTTDHEYGRKEWENGTVYTYARLTFRPGEILRKTVISCEVQHPETNTNLRTSITLGDFNTPRAVVAPTNSRVIKKSVKNPCASTNSFWPRMTLVGSIALLLILFVVFLAVLLRMNLNKKETRGHCVKNEEHNNAIELPNIEQHRHPLQSYTNVPFFN
ncbi:hypothetical protein niasHT_007369 [Heterodera trifolii]|uniref:Ig-like domain-containing protein n=1 Tax=Heterodera trifolii TaxID=157864 RepID=A0ABD2LLL9_9BILA